MNRVSVPVKQPAQQGFTLVEVLIAFVTLVFVMSGMFMALTSSMQLGTVQNQRSLGQDIVRNVQSRWLRSTTFTNIYPADFATNAANYVTSPHVHTLYDGTNGTNNLSSYQLSSLSEDLNRLPKATLTVEISPAPNEDGSYTFDSGATNDTLVKKVNAVVRIKWGAVGEKRRETSLASVVGESDLTRAPTSILREPLTLAEAAGTPTSNPSASPSSSPSTGPTASPSASASATASPTASPSASPSASASPSPSPSPTQMCLPQGAPTTKKSDCCSGNWTGSSVKVCT